MNDNISKNLWDAANDILVGNIDLVAGCRKLVCIIRELPDFERSLFHSIRGFESETDDYPLGDAREAWDQQTLERMDREITEYSMKCRPNIIAACQSIVEQYADVGLEHRKFHLEIDGRLLYLEDVAVFAVIDRGLRLSGEAAFLILKEICLPGKNMRLIATNERRANLVSYWLERFDHPLAKRMAEIANRLIQDEELTVDAAVFEMNNIAHYPGMISALQIAYFSCDDQNNAADAVYERIRGQWSV